MSIAQTLLPEFDSEMASTKKILELIPEGSLSWKPHPKSMPLQQLANHIVECVSWAIDPLLADQLDVNPPEGPKYVSPNYGSVAEILEQFDASVTKARTQIEVTDDQTFLSNWSLLNNGTVWMTIPKVAVVRSWVLNHIIHHRAQLGMYLRLLDVPLPGVYGPTADTASQTVTS